MRGGRREQDFGVILSQPSPLWAKLSCSTDGFRKDLKEARGQDPLEGAWGW